MLCVNFKNKILMRHTPQNSFSKLVLLNERTSTVLGSEKFRYGYQGSEKDNEVKGEGNSYTTEFRQLDPRLVRWLTIDPKANAWESPYVSMANSPILFNDVKGDIVPIIYGIFVATEIVVAYFTYDAVATDLQHSKGDRDVRQVGYGMKNPSNALKVLKASDIAGNMAINVSREIGHPENTDGSQRNAIRHAIWNALVVKSTGSKESAAEAVNSHETDLKIDWNQMTFANAFDADKSIDIRNNIIGRRVGEENKSLSNVEIAKKVLDEYHTKGLWTAKLNQDGTTSISKTKLSTVEYKKAIIELNKTSSETGKHKTK